MNREEKKQVVTEWQERFQTVKSAVLTDFRGLDVAQMTELRNSLRKQGVEYQVVKNTLLRKAVTNIGQEELHQYLTGPTGIACSFSDSVEPAKALKAFAKAHGELKLKAALVDGKVIGTEQVQRLADLPSKEVLIAQLLACFQAPMVNLVGALQANIRQLLLTLEAIKQKKSD